MRRTISILVTVSALVGISTHAAGANSEPAQMRAEPGVVIGEPRYPPGPKATLSLTDRVEPGHAATLV